MKKAVALSFLLATLGCATAPVLPPDQPIVTDERLVKGVQREAAPPPQAPGAHGKRIEIELDGTRLIFRPFGDFPMGFKVVWSKNPDPVYPTRPGDLALYRSPFDPHEVWLKPFSGEGQYYVRVFEFLGDPGTGLVSETLGVRLP